MPIWNREYERIDRKRLEQLQYEALAAAVYRVYDNVPFYRRKFDQANVKPEDIRSLSDVVKLPFISRAEMRDAYPYEMFAVPMRQIVRIHSTSGISGKPVVVGYTRQDLDSWAELVARVLYAAGVTDEDIVQISFGYGLFTGGFGLHYGAERLGASVIPVSSGNSERQIQIMQDFGTTVLVGSPSYTLYLIELMEEMGVSPASLNLRVGLFGGEPMTEAMRAEIESRLGIKAIDNYGVSAVMGPGIAGECELQCGLHINEDHFLIEVIDPKTLEPVPAGEEGELVITTLTREGLPILRYRTHDMTKITYEPCLCGRTTARMTRVHKRTDDMIIIRGINIYPSEIESILLEVENVEPQYQIVIDREKGLEHLTLNIEISPEMISDQMHRLVELEDTIRRKLHARLGLTPRVKLVEPRTLQSSSKLTRIIDNRS